MRASTHPQQPARLTALRSFNILDTPREARYDEIVGLVAKLCDAPIAVINLIDEDRQWFKAEVGLGVRETPLETSICSHVILTSGLTIIHDTLDDPRMCDNPLCFTSPNLRFYAGVCLETDDGLPIGTLCVLDHRPRDLSGLQREALAVLARQVMLQITLNLRLQEAETLRQEIDHRVKNSLSMVQAVLGLQAKTSTENAVRAALEQARSRVSAVASVHDQLYRAGSAADVNVDEFLSSLTRSLGSHSPDSIVITSEVPRHVISAKDATNLGLMVNELVTNAIRHGFAAGDRGQIAVRGVATDDRLHMTVTDSGAGLPSGFDPAQSQGLGLRIAVSLAKAFGSELQANDPAYGGGATFRFSLPLSAS